MVDSNFHTLPVVEGARLVGIIGKGDVLRSDLGITGPKYGCGEAVCGTCTVLVDGMAVRSCQTMVKEVDGSEVTTIEGLAKNGALHPIQKAFIRHGGFQCGYCTPGMILTAYSLLSDNPNPSREEIMEGMEDGMNQRVDGR